MPIEQRTPADQIASYIEQQTQAIIQILIRELAYIGEQCINAARQSQAYKDQTGNLRSSIGYLITIDGNIITQSSFQIVKQGNQGAKSGAAYAKQVARQFPEGIALILVAGMNYAAYVAARRGDVLDTAQLTAQKLVPQLLAELGLKT